MLHSGLHGIINSQYVHAVHGYAGNIIGCGTNRQMLRVRHPMNIGGHTVLVIFQNVDHRQFPCRRHVQRLMEGPLVRRAVTEVRNGNGVVSPQFRCIRTAGCQRNSGADNAVCTQNAQVGVDHVHGAAPTVAISGFLTEQLCQHLVRAGALGNAVSVAAMGCGDVVCFLQCQRRTHGAGLLSQTQMDVTGQLASCESLGCHLFELADADHHFIGMFHPSRIAFRSQNFHSLLLPSVS